MEDGCGRLCRLWWLERCGGDQGAQSSSWRARPAATPPTATDCDCTRTDSEDGRTHARTRSTTVSRLELQLQLQLQLQSLQLKLQSQWCLAEVDGHTHVTPTVAHSSTTATAIAHLEVEDGRERSQQRRTDVGDLDARHELFRRSRFESVRVGSRRFASGVGPGLGVEVGCGAIRIRVDPRAGSVRRGSGLGSDSAGAVGARVRRDARFGAPPPPPSRRRRRGPACITLHHIA